MDVPLTPADFAATEGRFKKQFRKLPADAVGVPVAEYIDLSAADQQGKTPFIWSTDAEKKLVKLEVSATLVHLVLERRKYWRTLQVLSGLDISKLDADHKAELDALQEQYKHAVDDRESSIDSIARAMSELAASSNAPASGGLAGADAGAAAPAKAAAQTAATNGVRSFRLRMRTSPSATTARPAIRTWASCSKRRRSSSTAKPRKWVTSSRACSVVLKRRPS